MEIARCYPLREFRWVGQEAEWSSGQKRNKWPRWSLKLRKIVSSRDEVREGWNQIVSNLLLAMNCCMASDRLPNLGLSLLICKIRTIRVPIP